MGLSFVGGFFVLVGASAAVAFCSPYTVWLLAGATPPVTFDWIFFAGVNMVIAGIGAIPGLLVLGLGLLRSSAPSSQSHL
jgi:hypothetical protein